MTSRPPSAPPAVPLAIPGAGLPTDPQSDLHRAESVIAVQHAVIDQVAIVAVTDPEGVILSVNDRLVEISGYRRTELIGANHRLLNSGLHPLEFWLDLYRTISAGRIWRGEIRNRAKDGSFYWVDTHIIPSLRPDGTIDSYTAVRFNITQRKQAEEAYRKLATLQAAILDHGGFAVISTRIDGTIESFNRAAEQMLGYRAEEVIGKTTPAIFHDPGEVTERARQFSVELGVPIADGYETFVARSVRDLPNEFEWTYRAKDGRRFPVLLSVTALRDEQQQITGFLGMAADISDRREREQALDRARLELQRQFAELTAAKEKLESDAARQVTLLEELALARDQATAAVEEKSAFLASMSHEIRTPMNGILGILNMLQSTLLTPEQTKLVELAARSSQDLVQITSDILDFSKLEAHKTEIEQADFEIGALVEDAIALLAPVAAGKGLALKTDIKLALPCHVTGDAFRIRQILVNFISNALKFTATGSVTVSVTGDLDAAKKDAGQGSDAPLILTLRVTDTGIGLDADAQSRLFDRFSQAEQSTTRRFGGTGLGLAICKQLAGLMGGTIGVESTPGTGSTFWVTLPLSQALPAGSGVAASALPAPTLRLLVAEDNSTNQLIIGAILRSLGHEVVLVTNGREAVDTVQTQDFDMVLMDVQMPVLDGPAATREIRRLAHPASRLPIIALTANAMTGDRESYLAAGMNDYVTKPIDPRRLMEALARQSETMRRRQK